MNARFVLAFTMLLAVSLGGCLGSEARSEWAYELTQLERAYDAGKRGEGVVVAVLDTGLNVGHPSLAHLTDGKTSNGEVIAFQDFVTGRSGVSEAHDPSGHGTHVTGIMSPRGSSFGDKLTNGGVDLRGGSPAIQLVIARVCADETSCNVDQIADAVDWSVKNGAQIISLSLGGEPGRSVVPGVVEDRIITSINRAIDKGIVVIAAAGNDGPEDSSDVVFPASMPGVIAVGAVNENGRVASFSNHGSNNQCSSATPLLGGGGRCPPHQKPELVAPGTQIISAWTGNSYVRASGTSQATPFVTSVVALMLEGHAPLADRDDVYQVKNILRNTTLRVEGQQTSHDDGAGYGIVQAGSAIQAYGG